MPSRLALRSYGQAALAVAAATAVGWPLCHGFHLPDERRLPLLSNTNILMLYLVAVLWVATRHRRQVAIVASILSVATFDLCFVPPFFRFGVADQQYLVTLAVMLLTAIVISTLTTRVHQQSAAARQAWERAEAEFLRNTLLSAVSHDLRTPIAGITGAVTTLIDSGQSLSGQSRAELLETIATEADRMEQRINNLLDMTRLDAGGPASRGSGSIFRKWSARHCDRSRSESAADPSSRASLPTCRWFTLTAWRSNKSSSTWPTTPCTTRRKAARSRSKPTSAPPNCS